MHACINDPVRPSVPHRSKPSVPHPSRPSVPHPSRPSERWYHSKHYRYVCIFYYDVRYDVPCLLLVKGIKEMWGRIG